jgi:hypothetical protein
MGLIWIAAKKLTNSGLNHLIYLTPNRKHESRKPDTIWILPSSGLLRSVDWLSTDVSGQSIGPIFKAHLDTRILTMGPICCPETSVLNQPTLRNDPEDGRTLVNRSGSLRSHRYNEIIRDTYRERSILNEYGVITEECCSNKQIKMKR